ncbi:Pls/PosA family non-ribosomal peptide synthetase [Pseudonocardia alaniniphila]|uniref:Phosphopantetheine-binding protein n=1 Tax=Pseudonocardia alaniniphila TaxID=75291 RepID=A0ABS9TSA0_9PSEU|nr:Pls/PosA family non-ribosomal peptide synthetase [Pseudonocardia alaniniphila]MCH6171437.1 phosphopantetheine-binding protein [Pseudonocardia alaniniphila]
MENLIKGFPVDLAESSPIHNGRIVSRIDIGEAFAEKLAGILDVDEVAVDADFFGDLGADSMVMARFCAWARKRPDLPNVSMKEIYRHPTVRDLTKALAPPVSPLEEDLERNVALRAEAAPARRAEYILCGALQLLVFLGYSYLVGVVGDLSYTWISAAAGVGEIYLRSVLFGGAAFVGMCTLPIAAKWILIGRWKPREIRVWSLAYVRFWIVKTLIRSNPLLVAIGGRSRSSTASPLLNLYLRALGAKIGRGVAIFSRNIPVCTDLLTIGAGTVVRKDSFISCYRAHNGMIQTGVVTLGKNVFVGEMTVVDIDVSMGDGTQLGHSSSLHAGQAVPAGERWHGSPAQPAEVDYCTVTRADGGSLRSALYGFAQLLIAFAVYVPLAVGGVILLLVEVPQLNGLLNPASAVFSAWTYYVDILIAGTVLFFGFVILGLLVVGSVPRLLNLAIKPDRDYPLYGFHYGIHKAIARMTNVRFFTWLFGDSNLVVHYLRWIGYDLPAVVQTGSNFGMEVRHESPYLATVGSGTVVADGLSIINAEFSNTSFRLSRATVGSNSFLGNNIPYPAQSTVGDNCLLATKVMVPVAGEIRKNTGLLGSPSFAIPRSVQRDGMYDDMVADGGLHRRLAAKRRHNVVTMALYLLVRWIYALGLTLLLAGILEFYDRRNEAAIGLVGAITLLFTIAYWILVERIVARFRNLQPRFCSIYDPAFWRHERFWKVPAVAYLQVLNGTPFKSLVWRLLGVRIGRGVFDDGATITERTLVAIGDHCTLNASSKIQCHSQEDGTFKSDHIVIGTGCTLGVGAFVHYGTSIGDGAVLATDSFLMKGEEMPRNAVWSGNPAQEIRAAQSGSAPGPGALARA